MAKIQKSAHLSFVTVMNGKIVKYRIKTLCYADRAGKPFEKPFEKIYDAIELQFFLAELIDSEADKQYIVSVEKVE